MPKKYWLMKCEPEAYTIERLEKDGVCGWEGVRNYQARNFMRDQMRLGDQVFFYHSSCPEPGIAGIAEVSKLAYPDETQFDPKSEYYDPKATRKEPRWFNVDVRLVRKTRLLGIQEMRTYAELAQMRVLQKGNRLSITPVDPGEWKFILKLLEQPLQD